MQSESIAQLPLQAVAPQTYAPHDCVCVAGHAPAPLQEAPSVATPPPHDASRHEVGSPGYAQAFRAPPSHAPPHDDPSVAQAARPPRGAPTTGEQTPAPLQASHCPLHAVSQQTPSTQWPVPHCVSPEHDPPCPIWLTQTPAEQ